MNKHSFVVCAILLSVIGSTTLKAGAAEEYKSIEQLDAEAVSATSESSVESAIAVPVESKTTSQPVATAPTIQYIIQAPAAQPLIASRASTTPDVYLETQVASKPKNSYAVGITPMLGGAIYAGRWAENTRNQYGLGLALEFPVSTFFAFELEGGYNKYRINYALPAGGSDPHEFDLFTAGGNAKIYLTRTMLRPYIGGGLMAVYYDKMHGLNAAGVPSTYSSLIGSANVMFGLDLAVSETVSFGARASYLIPVINKPFTANTVAAAVGPVTAPGLEDAGLINNNLWRVMGTMTIRL